jgi:hypothetical protein
MDTTSLETNIIVEFDRDPQTAHFPAFYRPVTPYSSYRGGCDLASKFLPLLAGPDYEENAAWRAPVDKLAVATRLQLRPHRRITRPMPNAGKVMP